MIVLGAAVALDGWGVGGALWRFGQSSYRRLGLAPRGNEMFIRAWFGLLLVVIGAGWIVVGAS
jgi:hypothetical protein